MEQGLVVAVSKSSSHTFSKANQLEVKLITGLGVDGDAHMGRTVKHRSRVTKEPAQPNLRQVHLIHAELFDELLEKGFLITPGLMGENITTLGIDILALPEDTLLILGEEAQVRITGLRNPCHQLEGIQEGLMKAVLGKDEEGNLVRKAGIMSVVEAGGVVRPGDSIRVKLPDRLPFKKLERV